MNRAIVSIALASLSVVFAALAASRTIAEEKPASNEAKPAEEKTAEAEPETFEELMKGMGKNKLILKKSFKSKDAAAVKDTAEKIRSSAAKAVEKDPKKERREAKDYKDWNTALEKEATTLRDLAGAKTPDWVKIEKQFETMSASCESCHDKYEEKEEEKTEKPAAGGAGGKNKKK